MQPVNISVTDNLTDPKHLSSSVQYLVYGVVLEPKNHQQCFLLSNYIKKTDSTLFCSLLIKMLILLFESDVVYVRDV